MPGSECISVHVGQAGIQIGSSCWELYCLEHGVHKDGSLQNVPGQSAETFNFFDESPSGKVKPRAVFVDLGPSAVDEVRVGEYSGLYGEKQLVSGGLEDSGGNFARGHVTLGEQYYELALSAIEDQVERCDSLDGFLVFCSWGGGTGSGYGAQLMEHLRVNYSKSTIVQFAVQPSPSRNMDSSVLEPYNSLLAMFWTADVADYFVLFDNEALEDICKSKVWINDPKHSDYNQIISQAVSSVTSSFRFEGFCDRMESKFIGLTPFGRMKYCMTSHAPLESIEGFLGRGSRELIVDCCSEESQMMKCENLEDEKYMGINFTFRGRGLFTPYVVNDDIKYIKSTGKIQFVEWCPGGFNLELLEAPPAFHTNSRIARMDHAVSTLSNSTAMSQSFKRIAKKVDKLYSRRAFVWWLCGEGMEEGEISEGRENLKFLLEDYEDLTKDEDEDYFDEDSDYD